MNQSRPTVYADFHNADAHGRLRLDCVGTTADLARLNIELREGMQLTLYADDVNSHGEYDELLADGVVSFSQEDQCWVALIDWPAVRHTSDDVANEANGAKRPTVAPLER